MQLLKQANYRKKMLLKQLMLFSKQSWIHSSLVIKFKLLVLVILKYVIAQLVRGEILKLVKKSKFQRARSQHLEQVKPLKMRLKKANLHRAKKGTYLITYPFFVDKYVCPIAFVVIIEWICNIIDESISYSIYLTYTPT